MSTLIWWTLVFGPATATLLYLTATVVRALWRGRAAVSWDQHVVEALAVAQASETPIADEAWAAVVARAEAVLAGELAQP